MQSSLEREPRSPRHSYVKSLIILAALAFSACTGIVVSPTDLSGGNGPTEFWGYASQPGLVVNLEAQTLSGTWDIKATATASATPTYVSTYIGYFYRITFNPTTLGAQYRRPASSPQNRRIHFRVKAPNADPAQTRSRTTVRSPGSAESTMEREWTAHYTADSILRIDVRN
jgi:hypothetical protein